MIVGRGRERAALAGALDDACSGRTTAVGLVGHAGMGKSTLLEVADALARERGMQVVRIACPEGSAEFRYAVVEDIAGGLPSALDALDAEEAALLAGLSRAGSVGPNRVTAALMHLVTAAQRIAPVAILADDLHWADSGSRAVMALLAGRLSGRRVAIVGTSRPRPGTGRGQLRSLVRIPVGPLDEQSAVDLLRAGLPESTRERLSDDRAARIAAALGCHPLALAECARLLTAEQILGAAEIPDPIPLDDRLVHAWGGAYLDLPAAAQDAVLAMCVTRGSGPGVLDLVLADAGLTRADLEPAIAARLVTPSAAEVRSTPDVLYPLMGAAIRGVAGPARVRAVHRRAARAALTLHLSPAVVIGHLAAGAEVGDEEAVALLQEQAGRALAAGHSATTARGLLAAAELSASGEARGRLAAQAARTLLAVSRNLTEAGRLVEFLSATSLTDEDRVWAEWLRAEHLADQDLRRSLAVLQGAADLAAHVGSPALVPILGGAVFTAWAVGDGAAALGLAQAYLQALPPSGAPDPAGPAAPTPAWAGLTLVGLTRFQLGDVAESERILDQARALSDAWTFDRDTDLGMLVSVVVLDEALGARRSMADPRLAEALRRLGGDSGESLSFLRNIQAARALRRGDVALARALVLEGLDLSRVVLFTQNVVLRLCTAVRIDAITGDPDVLQARAAELRSLGNRLGHVWAIAFADRAEGLLALGQGRHADAATLLQPLTRSRLLGMGPADPVPMGRADLVEALVGCGDRVRAEFVADELQEVLGPSTDPLARALLARVRGLLGTGLAARVELEAAADLFQHAGEAFEEARTRLALGELLARVGLPHDARHELALAAIELDRMGAEPWRARAAAALHSLPADEDVAAAGGWALLTVQERRVAAAVARGGSNRDVAAALSLSPRTVEHHLASAFRKLGVSSRTALAHCLSLSPQAPGSGADAPVARVPLA